MISMIVAVADNDGIGKDNGLPWGHIPADMKWFRTHTNGKVVVMGSSTWHSLPQAFRPLPNRTNVVLSSSGSIPGADLVLTGEPRDVINKLNEKFPDQEIVFIGGAKTYQAFVPFVNKVYLTRVNAAPEADTFLPIDDLLDLMHLSLTEQTVVPGDPQITFQIWEVA